jgi:hypothetical protein
MTTNNKIRVHFTHPRNSLTYSVNISPLCTGQIALDGLTSQGKNGRFLDPAPQGRTYQLIIKRNSHQITPTMTFQQAGVINDDYIDIGLDSQGAG